jgi:hypothetical protein
MTEEDQTNHFSNDVDKLVDRYRDQYEMSYAACVGVFTMKIHQLCKEADERAAEL